MVFHDDDLSPALARGSLNSDDRGFHGRVTRTYTSNEGREVGALNVALWACSVSVWEGKWRASLRSNYYGNLFLEYNNYSKNRLAVLFFEDNYSRYTYLSTKCIKFYKYFIFIIKFFFNNILQNKIVHNKVHAKYEIHKRRRESNW